MNLKLPCQLSVEHNRQGLVMISDVKYIQHLGGGGYLALFCGAKMPSRSTRLRTNRKKNSGFNLEISRESVSLNPNQKENTEKRGKKQKNP